MPLPPEHQVLESLAAPLMVAVGTTVVYANPACVELLGRPLEEFLHFNLGEHIDRTVDPADSDWVHDFNRARSQGGDAPSSYWVRVRNGAGRVLSLKVQITPGPRSDERTIYLDSAGPDADTRQLTDALAAASWRLVELRDEQSVLEAAAEALAQQKFRVVVLRVRGGEFFHAALRQDPRALEQLTRAGSAPMEHLPIPRENAPEFCQVLQDRRAAFVQDAHAIVRRLRPPDLARVITSAMPRRAVIAPIFVEGQPFGVLTAHHDELGPAGVGAIELFAHRVGSAIENVRHHRRAAERVTELQRLQEKLLEQERLATLGEAAAVLSHEVRNPVAAILNALAVLRRQPGALEAVRIAEEEALRLDRLVRDLLHLARPLEPKLCPFDLTALAERTLATVRSRLEPGAVSLELVAPGAVRALGDAFLLELALENLLNNAVRASPAGGRVKVSIRADRTGAVLAVEDQGQGVRPELAERIFEPFFTSHAAGTGLGLAVVRKVIQAHRGTVRFAPGALGGARFELALPPEAEC